MSGRFEPCFERRGDVLVFAALAGLAATFVHGYSLGSINNCQFPLLIHKLDPTLLAQDFYVVNTVGSVGIRFFYLNLLAFLSRLLTLPVTFFALTWLQNAAVALVTFVVGRRMFRGAAAAPVLATVLVMSVQSVSFGSASYVVMPELVPGLLAAGLGLFSLWQGIACRPVACALFALPAMLVHPLIGALLGLLGLAVSGLSGLFGIGLRTRTARLRAALLAGAMTAVLGGVALVFWAGVRGEQFLSDREYVWLYGFFRNPHHIVPSTFPGDYWVALAAFVAAAALSWWWWYRRPETERPVALRLALVVGLIFLLFLGGWLFVELWPSRLWATLQPFRLVFVLKWLGLLLFAGTAARLAAGGEPGQPLVAGLMFFPFGFGQPHAVLWAHVLELVRRRAAGVGGTTRWLGGVLALLVAAALVGLVSFQRPHWLIQPNRELLSLLVLGAMAAAWTLAATRPRRYLAALAVVAAAVALVVVNKYYPLPPLAALLRNTEPVFTLDEVNTPEDRVAQYCRDHTGRDAIFLVPPEFEQFRAKARRAVVIEYKCLLLSDEGLLDWYERLADCYGEVASVGFRARDEMARNHRRGGDDILLDVAERYGASYAVMHAATATGFPVVYEDESYKVVALTPDRLAPTVSVIAFRVAPGEVEYHVAYFNWLVQQQYPGAVLGQTYLSPVAAPLETEEAVAIYELALAEQRMEPLGDSIEPWTGLGPDGVPVLALFFKRQR